MLDPYAYSGLYSGIPAQRPMFMLSRRPDTYRGLTNETPEILQRYPGMRFMDKPGEPETIMEYAATIPDKEKYHW